MSAKTSAEVVIGGKVYTLCGYEEEDLVQKLENNIEAKEKEVYDLKHILISNQKQSDEDQEMIKRLKEENKELLLNKERLEKVLEEQLLENDN